ncbi:endopeptidase La, partial [Patescibacteria group bacterium]|nr:endopeptidase La [Patescibacteria group bacterium]MBU1200414.1 endopeptidase La [Patescibacteria group bacterium]
MLSPNNLVPLITLKEGVIYPQTEAILAFGRDTSIAGINIAVKTNSLVCFVSQKSITIENPQINDLYQVGTVAEIIKTLPVNNELHVLVKGLYKVKIHIVENKNRALVATVTQIPDQYVERKELTALSNHVVNQIKKALNLGKGNIDPASFLRIINSSNPVSISYQVASVLVIKNNQKQTLLEENNLEKRLMQISEHLGEEIKILQIERKIASKTQKKFDKNMRDNVLRERMRTIQKELGTGKDDDDDIKELRKKIKQAKLPKEIEKKTTKELKRLSKISIHSPESGYIRAWIEIVTELPWHRFNNGTYSIKKAEKILNQDHYGLEKVKERILEYIAVLKLRSKKQKANQPTSSLPTILCFVGPPGVGKTSVGKSIAKALNRKFVKMSLGGVRDEAEIRGHRRTYVGAIPGRIIQSIKECESSNPVFMLDELDKIGNDFRGDPASALLEALDPEQNYAFRDHYLDIPFDLSKVLFVTTANILDTIPPALMDRLEVIQFTGYTEDEKYNIAKKYLVPKQLDNHALEKKDIKIPADILRTIISHYTREAGVRSLEREIAAILRKTAKIKVSKSSTSNRDDTLKLTKQKLTRFLGPRKYNHTLKEEIPQPGIVTGLAYTQTGGDILFIEVAIMPGSGKIKLTGQLGDVMKESAQAAYSYVKSHQKQLGITQKTIATSDIHIHVPEGAIPKDGPSAGLAITTAIISVFSNKPVKKNLAMTGEVTLRGRALEIGGVKEKVIAAHRSGIKEIILPKFNKRSLIDVPDKVKKDLKFHYVSSMDEVIKIVFSSSK